jgi:hypothetical protein
LCVIDFLLRHRVGFPKLARATQIGFGLAHLGLRANHLGLRQGELRVGGRDADG